MPAARVIKFTAPAVGDHDITIPEEFLHKDEVSERWVPKDSFQQELNRRVESITKDLRKPEDLIKDDAFISSLVTTRRADVLKIAGIEEGKNAPDIEKIRNEILTAITKDQLDPMKTQLTSAEEEVNILRVRTLDADVMEAGTTGPMQIAPGLTPLVKMFVRERMGWDPKSKEWYVKKADGSGFEFSSDPEKGGSTYKKVKEFLRDLSRDAEKKSWFVAGTQDGGDYSGGGNGSATTLDAYNALAPSEKTQFALDHPKEFAKLMGEMQTKGENKLFARR